MIEVQKAVQEAILSAIAKNLKDVSVSEPGSYSVDHSVTFKVKGLVNKGGAVEYTPTVDIPLLPTLALVLEKSGFTREKSMDLLVEAMQEALALKVEANTSVETRMKDVTSAMERVREITDALPKKVRQGVTTFKGTVTSDINP